MNAGFLFYSALHSKTRSASTIQRYRKDYKKIATTDFANMEIDRITSIDIEKALIEAIQVHRLRENYVKNLMGYIGMALDYAFRQRYVNAKEFERVDKDMVQQRSEGQFKKAGCKPPWTHGRNQRQILRLRYQRHRTKKEAVRQLYSNVLNFTDILRNKKEAKVQ